MSCVPLDIKVGDFVTDINWISDLTKNFDGKTLTLIPSGPNPGISLVEGIKNLFLPLTANHSQKYMILGGKYLLILDIEMSLGSGLRSVTLVNFSTWTTVPILEVLADSTISPPVVNPSKDNGVVFLAYGQDGTRQTSVAIRRSDNGDVLCSVDGPIYATGETRGKATSTNLIIHYTESNGSHDITCPRPSGKCEIEPSSLTFPEVAVLGCPFTPPTKQVTIKNIGYDCLVISSIGENPPFRAIYTSPILPSSLARNETIDVTITFNPITSGTFSAYLRVNSNSVNGDQDISCNGTAVMAKPRIQFNETTFNFGTYPVGTPAPSKNLIIANIGNAPLTINVPALAVSGFTCAGFDGALNCGGSKTISLGFTPISVGEQTVILNIDSNASNNPPPIILIGEGCQADAEIITDPIIPIDFGQVQQGFRTVRTAIKVTNTGWGSLTFSASIIGPNAQLFGLPSPEGSLTNTPLSRVFTVNPANPCGNVQAGLGNLTIPISFFANDSPNGVSATLRISEHNAINFPSDQNWDYPLNAIIIPPVVLDIGLVVDRSGSMREPFGSRRKIDAAVHASQLFIELLRANFDDRITVTRFNEKPDVTVPITLITSNSPPTQNDILQSIQSNIPPPTGSTAIAGGVMLSAKELEKPRETTPPQINRAIVVLSDGIENTGFEDPVGSNVWYSILGGSMFHPSLTFRVNTLPMPRPPDTNIYSIGLGYNSDINPAQLNGLASRPENFFHVDKELTDIMYFNLEKYYTQIFMDIVGDSEILDPVYWISPGQKHEIEFNVLRGDIETLIVVYDWNGLRLPFYCISPRGEIIDPVNIPVGYRLRSGATSQARFVEIKMPLIEPDRYAGRWKVVVEHRGQVYHGVPKKSDIIGFVTSGKKYGDSILYGIAIGTRSNFRMVPFITPSPIYLGDPVHLNAIISEAGLPVTGCDVTVTATSPDNSIFTFKLLDDGRHSEGSENDGEYGNSFTHTYKEGTYHFHFKSYGRSRNGEPVMREAFRDKYVLRQKYICCQKTCLSEECCQQLLKEMRGQTQLIEKIYKQKTKGI